MVSNQKVREIQKSPISTDPNGLFIEAVVDSIQDIKGKNIVSLDLRNLDESPTDFFVICEGESNTQIKAISDNIYRRIKEKFRIVPDHTEGEKDCRWILVDYFNTVIHIFYPEARAFYSLESLWSDAKRIDYTD